LGRSWRTSPAKQIPIYLKKNYMQIGPPIPASSWSTVVHFAGSDTTFVHVITPYFHADGDVTMMMPRDDIKSEISKQTCDHRRVVSALWSDGASSSPLHEAIIVRVC